jgi:hypothetical protein
MTVMIGQGFNASRVLDNPILVCNGWWGGGGGRERGGRGVEVGKKATTQY